MDKIDYSIEYAHAYCNQTFNKEHDKSCKLMKGIEEDLVADGKTVQRLIMLDDCSTPYGLDRFDLRDYSNKLVDRGCEPDAIILESSLNSLAEQLVNKIENKKIKRSVTSYFASRNRYPCSMYISIWYLLRLGLLVGHVADAVIGVSKITPANRLITILPDRFSTPEQEAKQIIESTEYASYYENISVIFFDSIYEGYSDWKLFDPEEYSTRNYLSGVLPEDEQIIRFGVNYIDQFRDRIGMVEKFADIGCGPNLYPTLLASKLFTQNTEVALVDPVENNRNYISKYLNNPIRWKKFIDVMNTYSAGYSLDSISQFLHRVSISDGSIYEPLAIRQDMVTSFFVSESITVDIEDVRRSVETLKSNLRSGGLLIVAHMVGSNGYFAGIHTSFPATTLTEEDVYSLYEDLIDKEIKFLSHDNDYAARKGYKGMAIVAGFVP